MKDNSVFCKRIGIIRLLSVLVLAVTVWGTAVFCGAEKKTIAVMPIDNVSGYSDKNVAEIMTEELVRALHKSGKYVMVERTQLANAMKEIGFNMTGAVSQEAAVKAGKMAGADYSLIGKVTMATIRGNTEGNLANALLGLKVADTLQGQITVDVKVINNETGEIVLAESISGDKKGSTKDFVITRACADAADEFLKVLREADGGAFAHVVSVEGDIIHIDCGKEAGIKKDDVLLIVQEGNPVMDMEGNIIAVRTYTIGKAKVQEVSNGYAVCRIVDRVSGKTILRGSLIKWGD